MLSYEEHLDNLVRHIRLVQDACLLLGKRLAASGRKELSRILIGRGFVHDATKFAGIEWDYMHAGNDIPKDKIDLAVRQHVSTNDHHPEFHGGFERMPEACVAELAADWYARSMEFGTGLREWIRNVAIDKYKIDMEGQQYKWLINFVDMLLVDHFVR